MWGALFHMVRTNFDGNLSLRERMGLLTKTSWSARTQKFFIGFFQKQLKMFAIFNGRDSGESHRLSSETVDRALSTPLYPNHNTALAM